MLTMLVKRHTSFSMLQYVSLWCSYSMNFVDEGWRAVAWDDWAVTTTVLIVRRLKIIVALEMTARRRRGLFDVVLTDSLNRRSCVMSAPCTCWSAGCDTVLMRTMTSWVSWARLPSKRFRYLIFCFLYGLVHMQLPQSLDSRPSLRRWPIRSL